MPILDAIRLALAQLRVQKLKSFFTLLGVMIGVMFLIAVVSIVEGMGRYMEDDFAGRLLGANTFTLRRYPWFGNNTTREEWLEWQRRPRIYAADVAFVRSVLPPAARWAIESQGGPMASSPYARPRTVEAHAVDGEYFTIKKYDLASGRTIAPQEYELGAPVLVIGDEVAKYFFPNLNPVGRELRIGGIPYQVIGVIEHQGTLFGQSLDRLAVGPFNSPLHRLTNPRGDVSGLLVQSSSSMMMNDVMESVREALRAHRHLHPSVPDNFVMETSASALAFFEKVKRTMTIIGAALPALSLVVGGMVIMNIMLVSVSERTHEIGIRKSLGARRRDILSQFLVEAATLSTIGAIIGIALGIAAAKIVAWKTPLPAAVAPWSIVVATLLGTVVGIVSGVYPARRASRLDPIEALRQET
ncbi:MAG TPA: ABC transporter permease [Gemmatimonadaceae bacterium]|jgi:putative ABC transport system permease protein|nr:ABC transporter permease [Gemmatimonadaceae bacterium]